jgi:hypothetical protein
LPKPGTVMNRQPQQQTAPATQPVQAPQPGITGNRYLDIYNAGPAAQNKAVQDANLIHMIRGTTQTWGNPNITAGGEVLEFNSPLEAAAGVKHDDVVKKYALDSARDVELAKNRKPYEMVESMDAEGNTKQQAFNPNTGQVIDNEEKQDAAVAQSFQAGTMSDEEFQEYYRGANAKTKKMLRELIAGFENL